MKPQPSHDVDLRALVTVAHRCLRRASICQRTRKLLQKRHSFGNTATIKHYNACFRLQKLEINRKTLSVDFIMRWKGISEVIQ